MRLLNKENVMRLLDMLGNALAISILFIVALGALFGAVMVVAMLVVTLNFPSLEFAFLFDVTIQLIAVVGLLSITYSSTKEILI